MTVKRTCIITLALASVLAIGGCGTGPEPQAARTGQGMTLDEVRRYRSELVGGALDVSLLRIRNMDYPVMSSPEELAATQQTVAGGVVDGWQQGPATASYPGGPLEYRVVMRVRITDPLKGATGKPHMPEDTAYIEFDQGAVIRDDPKPAEEWKPEKSVSDFEASIPTGTKVVVFLRARPPYEQKIVHPGQPLPAGARIMSLPPQGLILEDSKLSARRNSDTSALVGGLEPLEDGGPAWLESKTVHDLVARLKSKGISD
ncbi:hypothetical protein [Spongiactinospora gelatinilytica]|nr:hypothetical protein [Spongiactinospora gelatinilytica]